MSGCNDESISLESDIISFGSNTANAVGPILKVIESEYGINEVFLTTVHGYSNSNRLADVAGAGFRKIEQLEKISFHQLLIHQKLLRVRYQCLKIK